MEMGQGEGRLFVDEETQNLAKGIVLNLRYRLIPQMPKKNRNGLGFGFFVVDGILSLAVAISAASAKHPLATCMCWSNAVRLHQDAESASAHRTKRTDGT